MTVPMLAQVLGAVAPSNRVVPTTPDGDQTIISAWQSRTLTDGTKLDLGRTDREQGFVLRDGGIFPIVFRASGKYVCDNGRIDVANVIRVDDIRPNSGGHTPRGQSSGFERLAGPEDGQLAERTGKPAYVISSRGAFKIEKVESGFEIKLLAGSRLTPTEQGEIAGTIARWNRHDGGSGVRCKFIPD